VTRGRFACHILVTRGRFACHILYQEDGIKDVTETTCQGDASFVIYFMGKFVCDGDDSFVTN
jgi:hypothetical protein